MNLILSIFKEVAVDGLSQQAWIFLMLHEWMIKHMCDLPISTFVPKCELQTTELKVWVAKWNNGKNIKVLSRLFTHIQLKNVS